MNKKYLGVVAALSIGAASIGFVISENNNVGNNNVIKISEIAGTGGSGNKTFFSSFYNFFFSSDSGTGGSGNKTGENI
jgi:hypothetical protein